MHLDKCTKKQEARGTASVQCTSNEINAQDKVTIEVSRKDKD